MKIRQLLNEKGVTLVELLAALSLFAVVIALSSTVIIQMVNSEGNASDRVSLQQEMNVVISELRNKYYNGKPICLNDKKNRFTITKVSNGEINNSCIENLEKDKPLSVEITAANSSGEAYTVKTTWKNKKEYVLNIATDDEGNNNITCEFQGTYTNLTLKNGRCGNKYYMIGSLKAIGQTLLEKDVKLKIRGSAHFTGDIKLFNNAKIVTSGSIQIDGDVFCNGEEIPVHKKSTLRCKN